MMIAGSPREKWKEKHIFEGCDVNVGDCREIMSLRSDLNYF